jgi:gas vesicle protein
MAISKSSSLATALVGAAGGALAIYLLDPKSGQERRDRLRAAAGNAIDEARHHVQQHIDSLSDLVRQHAAQSQDAASHVVDGVRHSAQDAAKAHVGAAAERLTGARAFVSDTWNKAQAAIDEARNRSRRAAAAIKGEDRSGAVVPVVVTAVACCAVGVGLMWALDPDEGRGRRAELSQRAHRIVTQMGHRFNSTGRHFRNKMRGYAAVARRNVNDRLSSHEPEPAQG